MTVPVVATVSFTTRGTLQNEACVHAAEADPVPSNNCAPVVATVAASANLVTAKPPSPLPVTAGRTITYTIVATNSGPSSATNVNVTDSVPAGITVTAPLSTTGPCAPVPATGPATLTCGPGTLSPGQSMTVTVVATVSSTTRGTLQNEACVHATEADPVPSNNCATDVATVAASSNVSATTANSTLSLPDALPISYTIVATNSGPSSATNVNVTDSVPA